MEHKINEFNKQRSILVNEILDKIVDYETFIKNYNYLKKILPLGNFSNEMPDGYEDLVDDITMYYHGETVYFDDIFLTFFRENEDGTFNIKELNKLKDYIRENMICGTVYDW